MKSITVYVKRSWGCIDNDTGDHLYVSMVNGNGMKLGSMLPMDRDLERYF